ncbi:Transcriptional regulator prz1 [Hypsizygus marmoreus]|uniref:Transcriptional regulator prz1 n=1 Tax=Hypsizygus marmoreus TaxID=39966 RepID=A0A369JPC2_HYPMA|nr:Transcriptional regulator prz1 [Hypsizygus marmoreus]
MHTIETSFPSLDLENSLPYMSYQNEEDRNSVLKIFASYSDSLYAAQEPTYFSEACAGSYTSPSHWNPLEQNPSEPLVPCDPTLLHPWFSCSRPSIYENHEDSASWTWGESSGSSSPCSSASSTFPCTNGQISFTALLASPTCSSTYSYEDGTPSPLQLNEFSNVFDFDYAASIPTEYAVSSPQSTPLPSSISRRRASAIPIPNSSRNVYSPSAQRSREPSPANSEGDQRRRFPCLVLGCARRFTSQYTLKVHMEAHKPKPRVSFPCTLGCPERFSRQHDRLRHEVAKHGKVCEFSCDECGRFFSSSKTLGNHRCPVARGGTRWVNH